MYFGFNFILLCRPDKCGKFGQSFLLQGTLLKKTEMQKSEDIQQVIKAKNTVFASILSDFS